MTRTLFLVINTITSSQQLTACLLTLMYCFLVDRITRLIDRHQTYHTNLINSSNSPYTTQLQNNQLVLLTSVQSREHGMHLL